MSAVWLDAEGRGALICNRNRRGEPDCPARFLSEPGESVQQAQYRARLLGWITIEAFGAVADICPSHRPSLPLHR